MSHPLTEPPAEAVRKTRVLIVDDHPIVREGLRGILGHCADLEVCGEAEDSQEALNKLKLLRPQLAVIDISLKTGNGIELVSQLRTSHKNVRLLVWSVYPENIYAERAVGAGALGYIEKGRSREEILKAIRTVAEGNLYLSQEMLGRVSRRALVHGADATGNMTDVLTDRQLEVFRLIGLGLTTVQMAERLSVSAKTVESHRLKIKEKLGVNSLQELYLQAATWVEGCQ